MIETFFDEWCKSLPDNTRKAYLRALERFSVHLGTDDRYRQEIQAINLFLQAGRSAAHEIYFGYQQSLLDLGYRLTTVNQCLSPIRRLVKLARTRGIIPWELEAPVFNWRKQPPPRAGRAALLEMVSAARKYRHRSKVIQGRAIARNVAILYLLGAGASINHLARLKHNDLDLRRRYLVLPQGEEIAGRFPAKNAGTTVVRFSKEVAQALGRWILVRHEMKIATEHIFVDVVKPGGAPLRELGIEKMFAGVASASKLGKTNPRVFQGALAAAARNK